MKIYKTLILAFILAFHMIVFPQFDTQEKIKKQIGSKTDSTLLKNLALEFRNKYEASKSEAVKMFLNKGYPIKKAKLDGSVFEFRGFY